MTTLYGDPCGDIPFDACPFISSNLDGGEPGYGGGIIPTAVSPPVSKSDTQPIDVASRSITGAELWGPGDVIYQGVHLVPHYIETGNVLTELFYSLEVWNATDVEQLCTALNEVSVSGIELPMTVEPPTTFGALESRSYTVTVTPDGESEINGYFQFLFPPNSPKLEITGSRVKAFTQQMNWANGITERLEFMTDVIEAYSGGEQRLSLRANPRRSIEFNVTIWGDELRFTENRFYGWQARTYAVPLWMYAQYLAADVLLGETFVPFDTEYRDFALDGGVLLMNAGASEQLQIESIESNGVTLSEPLQATWPKGSLVMPYRDGRMLQAARLAHHTDLSADVVVRFDLTPGQSVAGITEWAGETYKGYTVFPGGHNFTSSPAEEIEGKTDKCDYETGIITIRHRDLLPYVKRDFAWLLKSKAEIAEAKGFFMEIAGRLNSFYMPSELSDFTLVSPIGSGGLLVGVKKSDFNKYAWDTGGRKQLAFLMGNGTWRYRQIESIDDTDPDYDVLTIDAAWPDSLQPIKISFLELCRLEQDTVEIKWETDSVARIAFTRRVLE